MHLGLEVGSTFQLMSTLQTAIALSLLVFMVHGLRLVLTHASLGIEDWVV